MFFKSKNAEQDDYFQKNKNETDRLLWIDRCDLIFRHLYNSDASVVNNGPNKLCAASKVDGELTNEVLESSSPIFTHIFALPEDRTLP